MTAPLWGVATVVLAYLMGAIPTGLLVARWRGVDIRAAGSGNIGATNVLRAVGPFAAILVVLIDPLKGVAGRRRCPRCSASGRGGWPAPRSRRWWATASTSSCASAAARGWRRASGVFVVIDPWVTLVAVAIFALTVALGRMVSLASLVAVLATPIMLVVLGEASPSKVVLAFAIAALLAWRHRDNVARLAAGTERRLGGARRG